MGRRVKKKNPFFKLSNLSSTLLSQVVEQIQQFSNSRSDIFYNTEEAIFFAAQVAVVLFLFVQLEGKELEGCSDTSSQK